MKIKSFIKVIILFIIIIIIFYSKKIALYNLQVSSSPLDGVSASYFGQRQPMDLEAQL